MQEDYEKAKAIFEEMYADGRALYEDGELYIMGEAENVGKPWYKSKTIWLNALAFGVVLFQAFGLGQEDVALIEAAAIPMLNLVLRKVTKEPIG